MTHPNAKLTKIESQLNKALQKFTEFYVPNPTEVYKVASTQAFEFTFELSWKYLREILKSVDQEYFDSPKAVFKLAGKKNLLTKQEVEQWLIYLESRNLTVHMYNQEVADQIFQSLVNFEKSVAKLLTRVEKYLEMI